MSQSSLLQRQAGVNRAFPIRAVLLSLATVCLGTLFFLTDHNLVASPAGNPLEELESGNRFRQVGFASIGLLGCLLFTLSSGRRFAFNNSLSVVLCIYIGLCLASMIWADHTTMSSKRFLMSVLCFLGAMGICRQFSPLNLCRSILVISFAYLCIGVCAEFVSEVGNASEGGYRFGGTLHTNAQAVNCAFLCTASVCLFRDAARWRWALAGMFLVGLVFLVLTGSRGALYSLLFAILAYWWLNSSGYKRALGLTVLPAFATFVVLVSLMFGVEPEQLLDITQLGRDRASVTTVTGRLPLWNALFDYIEARPLFGYGYQAFWSVDRYSEIAGSWDWIPTHAHSAYVDTALSLGFIGVLLYVLAIAMGIYQANQHHVKTGDAGYRFILMVLLMVPIYSLTESRYAAPSCLYSTVFFYALFFMAFCANPDVRPEQRPNAVMRTRRFGNAPPNSSVSEREESYASICPSRFQVNPHRSPSPSE